MPSPRPSPAARSSWSAPGADTNGALFGLLEAIGAEVTPTNRGLAVHRNGVRPTAVDVTTDVYPAFPTDLQAQFMALMAIAEGTSHITETVFENRFMHVPELVRMGADIKVEGELAVVRGVPQAQGRARHGHRSAGQRQPGAGGPGGGGRNHRQSRLSSGSRLRAAGGEALRRRRRDRTVERHDITRASHWARRTPRTSRSFPRGCRTRSPRSAISSICRNRAASPPCSTASAGKAEDEHARARRPAFQRCDRVSRRRICAATSRMPWSRCWPSASRPGAARIPGGEVELVFSGGGALKLEVECIDAGLSDLGGEWAALGRPRHEDGA